MIGWEAARSTSPSGETETQTVDPVTRGKTGAEFDLIPQKTIRGFPTLPAQLQNSTAHEVGRHSNYVKLEKVQGSWNWSTSKAC